MVIIKQIEKIIVTPITFQGCSNEELNIPRRLIKSKIKAEHFALIEMARFSRQFLMASPKIVEFSIRDFKAGEDLEKQKHASSANGVLGKSGKGIPARASNTDIYPALR